MLSREAEEVETWPLSEEALEALAEVDVVELPQPLLRSLTSAADAPAAPAAAAAAPAVAAAAPAFWFLTWGLARAPWVFWEDVDDSGHGSWIGENSLGEPWTFRVSSADALHSVDQMWRQFRWEGHNWWWHAATDNWFYAANGKREVPGPRTIWV